MAVPEILLVDCDPGVDDAIALAFLAERQRAGLCRVELVTTVSGNVPGRQTAGNAVQVVESVGLGCGVHAGCDRPLVRRPLHRAPHAHGEDGLCGLARAVAPTPDGTDGVLELVDAVRSLADESQPPILLAVGPLTNVATALALEPSLPTLVRRLVVMGGAFGVVKGNATPWAEFNFASDPEAARAVCHAGFEMTLVPLDVTHEVVVSARDVETLVSRGANAFVVEVLAAMVAKAGSDEPGRSYVHDALAAMVALDPGLVRTERLVVDVVTQEPEAGHAIGRSLHPADVAGTTTVDVAVSVDSERAMRRLMGALSGQGRRLPDDPP